MTYCSGFDYVIVGSTTAMPSFHLVISTLNIAMLTDMANPGMTTEST